MKDSQDSTQNKLIVLIKYLETQDLKKNGPWTVVYFKASMSSSRINTCRKFLSRIVMIQIV